MNLPSWLQNIVRCLAISLAGTAGFALTCLFIRWQAPFPEIPQITDKLREVAAGRYDVVFLGSSKVFHGIVPEVFDAEMQQRGWPVRSYNLGVDGMGFPESAYFFEQAIARMENAPRWVLIELAGLRTTLAATRGTTQRDVYWHDWARTRLISDAMRTRGIATWKDLQRLLHHWSLWLQRLCNRGDGTPLLLRRLGFADEGEGRAQPDPAARGYAPIVRRQGHGFRATYEKEVQALRAQTFPPTDVFSEKALRGFARRIALQRSTPIFFVPPNPTATRTYFADGRSEILFRFDDPNRFESLYRLEYRADALHLNDAGAREFSRVLAARFALFLETTRGRAPTALAR